MGIIPTLNTFVAGTPIVASAMNSNFEAIVTVVNGGIDNSNISQISADKVTSGEFDPDRIPNLDAGKITSGVLAVARGGTGGNSAAAARSALGVAAASHTHDAGDITSGTLTLNRLPTSGTANRFLKVGTANSVPTYSTVSWSDVQSKPSTFPPSAHSADLLTSGTVPAARLPATITGNKTFNGTVTFSGSIILPVL